MYIIYILYKHTICYTLQASTHRHTHKHTHTRARARASKPSIRGPRSIKEHANRARRRRLHAALATRPVRETGAAQLLSTRHCHRPKPFIRLYNV